MMIDLHQLTESIEDDLDSSEKYQAALRLLSSTARKYNKLYEDFERLKEATGFNKPFPFLSLPRELRDKIYTYSLRAAKSVQEMPSVCFLTVDNPFKPPTPGLLRANKQIYNEAVEILYSRNMFRFQEPDKLFAFEEQIGSENRKRVRQICFWFFNHHTVVSIPDPKDVPRSEYESVPSHWIAALQACRFEKIVHLGIEAEILFDTSFSLLTIPKELQEFIEEYLGRKADDVVPRLSLTGFREEEREKFPERWEVVIDQWDHYKEQIEAFQSEMEEYSDPRWTFDIGNVGEEEEVSDEEDMSDEDDFSDEEEL